MKQKFGHFLMFYVLFLFQCNGMSNRFWGWGREDDEFYRRLKKAQLQVRVCSQRSGRPRAHFHFVAFCFFSCSDRVELLQVTKPSSTYTTRPGGRGTRRGSRLRNRYRKAFVFFDLWFYPFKRTLNWFLGSGSWLVPVGAV